MCKWVCSNIVRSLNQDQIRVKNSHKVVVYQASFSLMAFGHDALKIREILVRMALSDNSPSATAILQSTLALASYHRDKDHSRADRLKIAALRALAASTQGVIGVEESIRHIAAGMLLCTLEVCILALAYHRYVLILLRFTRSRRHQVTGCGMYAARKRSLRAPNSTREHQPTTLPH